MNDGEVEEIIVEPKKGSFLSNPAFAKKLIDNFIGKTDEKNMRYLS
jgi:hypothetical protein